jgi:hypothetical protein
VSRSRSPELLPQCFFPTGLNFVSQQLAKKTRFPPACQHTCAWDVCQLTQFKILRMMSAPERSRDMTGLACAWSPTDKQNARPFSKIRTTVPKYLNLTANQQDISESNPNNKFASKRWQLLHSDHCSSTNGALMLPHRRLCKMAKASHACGHICCSAKKINMKGLQKSFKDITDPASAG